MPLREIGDQMEAAVGEAARVFVLLAAMAAMLGAVVGLIFAGLLFLCFG